MAHVLLVWLMVSGCEERPEQQPLPQDVQEVWGLRPVAPTDTDAPGEPDRADAAVPDRAIAPVAP